ncbi:FAD binding domain-containing protein [Pholiota conissans]|uniref:FAD binding domain-containing protein n=1 Tax=Pholiota conissans TaxID=109636 RepID=A0A9P6D3G4_9AGAR|nr:FAD binding domain-containing protein [Pholiota conissans]
MAPFDTSPLVQEFKGDVVTPEHPGYKEAIARWAANAERNAKVVAFVKDSQDVAAAIKFARANGLPIAVRGGGHNVSGASSVDDGLVIDLSRFLNKVTVDPLKKLAYVGGGAIWEAVDMEGIKHGLATVAGTVNHTGVGGLVLGGGYGWLTGAHGLAADNVVQATVVTADGSVLTASKEENEDLYFGIRGAGGNFGVVTEFVFQLYPQRPTVYAGMLVFAPPALEKLLEVTRKWWDNVGQNEGMLQVTTVAPDGKPAIVLFVFYNGSEAEGREKYKAFFDVGPVADLTKEIPYGELNGLQNPMAGHGKSVYWKGVANKHMDYMSIKKAHEKVIEAVGTSKFQAAILYEYFPLNNVNAVPRNATAFRREMVNNVLINLTWDRSGQDHTEEARKISHDIADIILSPQSDMTKSEILGYGNYDPEASEISSSAVDKVKIAFGENYPKLQAIKKRYDPENIFNKWFAIVPA